VVEMKTITNRNDLLRAIGLLKENPVDELNRQKKMSREANKIRNVSEEEKEDKEGEEDTAGDDLFGSEGGDEGGEEEEGGGEEEGSEEGGEEDKGEEKKTKKDLPGSKELRKTPAETPASVTGLSVIDRINKIRAGASMKDEKVMKSIDNYVTSLTDDQARSMYTYLDALARMVLGGMDPSEVPVPRGAKGASVVKKDAKVAKRDSTADKVAKGDDLPIVSPVTVGEGVKRKLKEVDVPVRNGRVVPFGSKAHIADLQGRIDDLERIRSYQEPGSESRHSLGLAVRALKSQLKAAMRRTTVGNPRVQPMPPIVEKEK
jgi:hypothetical protein